MSTFIQIKDSIVDFLIYLKPTGAEQYLMSIGAVIGLVFSVSIGGMDSMIYALIALCIVDYITGMFTAFKTGQWDSSTGFRGILKKFVIFAVVALCNCIDTAMGMHILRQMAICAYALNEAGSIIENVDRAGYSQYIPDVIRNALARLTEKAEEGKLKVK
jgi:toxin secretion/phage lysis holin|nr:MAG TPA: holin [Caudoviricetes sp.]